MGGSKGTLKATLEVEFEFPPGYTPGPQEVLSEAMSYVAYLKNFKVIKSTGLVVARTRGPLYRQSEGPHDVPDTAGTYTPKLPQGGCSCHGYGAYFQTHSRYVTLPPGAEAIERCDTCYAFKNDYDAAVYYYQEPLLLLQTQHGYDLYEAAGVHRKDVPGWPKEG